ncbi:galactokinase [Bacillus amyloliquefaciens]|uniref:Galactokinase n=1 Tax=Bacillus amyloliquefaciens TaxID=1390 RepID=A0AAP7N6Y0_BACAM|nr:galactokinase [Bacillus amyloliquefaciens]OIK21270.1 galactokinase [Bacillus amyloliquefaciens]
MKHKIKKAFADVFGESEDLRIFFAPGRVNLIGEHTDYNGGHVFPCALTIGTYAAVRERGDRLVRMYSDNFKEAGIKECSLDEIRYQKEDGWANYPKGVMAECLGSGFSLPHGFDIVFLGNIPNGAGLSSSASIELVTAVILKECHGLDADMLDLVKLAQAAENSFIGVSCGIMDQFAIGMGKKDHAILLNCGTLAFEYTKLGMSGLSIVIANTNKKRTLADSSYNTRLKECREALFDLQKHLSIQSLGELSPSAFDAHAELIQNEVNRRRAKHAVYENHRTQKAADMFSSNQLHHIGELMRDSHLSLRDDYEVTSLELDTLAEAAWRHAGVVGSRMTGAGFGGCTVSIVKDEAVSDFIETAGACYEEQTGRKADFYTADIGAGARELKGDDNGD